jgi:hypothetical protein
MFDDDDDEADYISIPFLLTEAQGGEYNTESFTAGWHLGILESRLAVAATLNLMIPSVVLRLSWKEQADLLAMSHGMVTHVTPVEEDDELGFFTFAPPGILSDGSES